MAIDISGALKNPGAPQPVSCSLDVPSEVMFDDPVDFRAVELRANVTGTDGGVSLRGLVSAQAISRCASCLEEARLSVVAELDELFVRDADPDDPDRYGFSGHTLDPAPMVREALLLQVPMRFVCAEDCQGLCGQCGTNLNHAKCACPAGNGRENPFAALRVLLNDEEE